MSNLMNNLKDLAEMLEADAHHLDDMKEQNVKLNNQIHLLTQRLESATESFSLITCADHKESQRIANDWLKETKTEAQCDHDWIKNDNDDEHCGWCGIAKEKGSEVSDG